MPEIEIRPAIPDDIPALVRIDHSYTSDRVWQMEAQPYEEHQVQIAFRETRLPRSVRVDYPRPVSQLLKDWEDRVEEVLVAVYQEKPVGYISLSSSIAPSSGWATDMAVVRALRRQGIGTALLLSALEWSGQHHCRRLVVEMQPRNYPAIKMVQKLGFEFCGFTDHYYNNLDIGLFFSRALR